MLSSSILSATKDYFKKIQRPKKSIYLAGGEKWVFASITDALHCELGKIAHAEVRRTRNPWKESLSGQVIHFSNRRQFLHGDVRALSKTNDLMFVWYHGDWKAADAHMRGIFDLLEKTQKFAKQIIVPCRISYETLEAFGIPSEKLVLIPIGVDLKLFKKRDEASRRAARQKLGIPEDAVCLGSFQKDGHGWEEGMDPKLDKGPDIFLEVVRAVWQKHSRLWVLLTGPARGYVKQGLAKMGVPFVHRFLDDYEQIVSCYHALDCYLIASRCEGGPASLLESWAAEVPLVSTRVGMPADWMRHEANGLLADSEDVENLSRGVLRMIEDHSFAAKCASRGGQDVQKFSWAEIALQHYQKLYEPCL